MKNGLIFPALLLLAFFAGTANAELILTAGLRGGPPSAVGVATAGTQVEVDLFVTQRGSFGFGPEFRLQAPASLVGGPAEDGSLGFGGGHVQIGLDASGEIKFSGGASGNTAPAIAFVEGVFPNASSDPNRTGLTFQEDGLLSFDAFARDSQDGNVITPLFVSNTRAPSGAEPQGTPAENSILLGTFTVDLAANASGDYLINLQAPLLGSAGNTLNPFFGPNIDATYAPSGSVFTLQVSAVPEPGAFALLSVFAVGVASRRRRKV